MFQKAFDKLCAVRCSDATTIENPKGEGLHMKDLPIYVVIAAFCDCHRITEW